MQLAKVRDRSEIRLVPRCQHPKPHILAQLLLHPARGKPSHTVPINQNLAHHPRMIRWLTPLFLLVLPTRWRSDPIAPPRRRRNTPGDLPATSRAGSAVTENLVQAGRRGRFFPCSETWHI